jgi:hypothetical protein
MIRSVMLCRPSAPAHLAGRKIPPQYNRGLRLVHAEDAAARAARSKAWKGGGRFSQGLGKKARKIPSLGKISVKLSKAWKNEGLHIPMFGNWRACRYDAAAFSEREAG